MLLVVIGSYHGRKEDNISHHAQISFAVNDYSIEYSIYFPEQWSSFQKIPLSANRNILSPDNTITRNWGLLAEILQQQANLLPTWCVISVQSDQLWEKK